MLSATERILYSKKARDAKTVYTIRDGLQFPLNLRFGTQFSQALIEYCLNPTAFIFVMDYTRILKG